MRTTLKIQRYRRIIQNRSWRYRKLVSILPRINCIDVGAAYFPHTSWWLLLDSPETQWIAVEPNVENIEYLRAWPWKSKVKSVTTGLSQHGGIQNLYITNVDSGSSLLEPVIPKIMKNRVGKIGEEYVFPIRKIEIQTTSLKEVLTEFGDAPTMIKLDTQGSELAILKSIINEHEITQVVGIEIECSLLADPLYLSSPRLWEVALYLEQFGYELLNLEVLPVRKSRFSIFTPKREMAREADAVFGLRSDYVSGLSIEHRVALIAFYLTYNLETEARTYLEIDAELQELLKKFAIKL